MTEYVEIIEKRLERMERMMLSQKTVLTFDECCQYTGWSTSHLYKLTSRREIPHSKPGGKDIFFERSKIDEYLLKNPIKSNQEIQQEASSFVLRSAPHRMKRRKV